MLPRVYTVDQVEKVANTMKYPPVGARGCATGRANNDFQSADVGEFMEGMNRESMLIVQVETTEILGCLDEVAEILGCLDEVAAIPAVDVLFVSPCRGVKDNRVTDACEKVIETCVNHGTPALQVNAAEDLAGWRDRGMQMLSGGSEMGFLGAGVRLFSAPLKR